MLPKKALETYQVIPASGVTVNGTKYGLLLDTGSRATLAQRDLLERLSATHPSWPHSTGASGTADMPGSDGSEFLLRVPEVVWGTFHIRNVLFVSRPDAAYSPDHFETPEPIDGALGGNVLKNFRIEIDYPHGETYDPTGRRIASYKYSRTRQGASCPLTVMPRGCRLIRAWQLPTLGQ
jgi:hypothetical protein